MFNDLELHASNILKWMRRDKDISIGHEGYIDCKLGCVGIINHFNQITGKENYGDVILVLKDKRVFRVTVEKKSFVSTRTH